MNVENFSIDLDTTYVLRTVEERGVRFVRLWFVDVMGTLKSFSVPSSELEQALAEGVSIDGSSLEGTVRLRERDMIARPDPRTFQLLPWSRTPPVGRMFCDIRSPDGIPFPGDSRHALRAAVARASELGYTFQVGCELEFFLFAEATEDGEIPRPLDRGAYFDLTPRDEGSDFRRQTIEHLEQMGIPVKASHHEVGPSQHEIQLQYHDAQSMADAVSTFRLVVKEVAHEQGIYATFMPKPLENESGSGMHLHLSLFEGESNAFYGGYGEPLSSIGQQFLAGVLTHARELTVVTNPWVNSYKRLGGGFEAPSHADWTRHGREALVRVPSARPGRPSAARIEVRSPDPSCNPYLALALLLAAGLRGIERGYELPPEAEDQAPVGAPRLPEDLREATALFAESELAHETLGERLCEWYVANAQREWCDYQRTVTEFERRRYLPIL
ncbi:MAG TPA: glutamine synthetase family protein [Solirubrobacteraceae bacterium]|nr:glutamine synthetase family protein [Solirubrobacteraceae bacterium]